MVKKQWESKLKYLIWTYQCYRCATLHHSTSSTESFCLQVTSSKWHFVDCADCQKIVSLKSFDKKMSWLIESKPVAMLLCWSCVEYASTVWDPVTKKKKTWPKWSLYRGVPPGFATMTTTEPAVSLQCFKNLVGRTLNQGENRTKWHWCTRWRCPITWVYMDSDYGQCRRRLNLNRTLLEGRFMNKTSATTKKKFYPILNIKLGLTVMLTMNCTSLNWQFPQSRDKHMAQTASKMASTINFGIRNDGKNFIQMTRSTKLCSTKWHFD